LGVPRGAPFCLLWSERNACQAAMLSIPLCEAMGQARSGQARPGQVIFVRFGPARLSFVWPSLVHIWFNLVQFVQFRSFRSDQLRDQGSVQNYCKIIGWRLNNHVVSPISFASAPVRPSCGTDVQDSIGRLIAQFVFAGLPAVVSCAHC